MERSDPRAHADGNRARSGSPPRADDRLGELYSSPEYLIRRAHQIATAGFARACADLDLTTSQYSALFALREHSPVGQNELGRLVALDRSTTSLVVRSLRERGLVEARSDQSDRRKSFLELTDKGREVLDEAERRSARSQRTLLSAFEPGQADEFIAMLRRLDQSAGTRIGAGSGDDPER